MTYDLRAVAGMLGVSLRTVQGWVAHGELRACNVSRSRSSRKPRLRVLDSDLQMFLVARAVGHELPRAWRRRALPPMKEYV